jgi:Undecaprenyl-phosphate glucose phosphotransferase
MMRANEDQDLMDETQSKLPSRIVLRPVSGHGTGRPFWPLPARRRFERVLQREQRGGTHARSGRRPFLALDSHSFPVLGAVIEFATVAATTFEAGALYHQFTLGYLPSATFYFAATLCLSALYAGTSAYARDYSLKRLLDAREQLRSAAWRWNYSFSLFVVALFMIQATDFYSRGSLVVQYAAGLSAAVIVRLLLMRFVSHGLDSGNLQGRKVVVVGEAPAVTATIRRLRREGQGIEVVGVVTLDTPPLSPSDDARREPGGDIRTVLQVIENIARRTALDDVVLCLSWSDGDRIRAFIEGLAVVPAAIHLAPDDTWEWMRDPSVVRVGQMPTVRLSRAPLFLRDRILKRAFDVAAASLGLLLLAPAFAAIAAMIRLDSAGPIFFRQRRHGFNQQEFRVLKFRTMSTLDDGPVIHQARRDDARVTRVGRFLRATNLDELPQLFNVVMGDMSLVGPRPHAVAHNNAYEERIRLYARRHNVKPGITGWAQVNGLRGETDSIDKMHRRVEHDLFYIDHWSLVLDIKILILTLFSPRSYRNAY